MHYSLSDTTCDPLGLLEKELSFQFQGANYLNQFEWELRFFVLVEPFCLIGGNKTDYFHIIVYQKDKPAIVIHC